MPAVLLMWEYSCSHSPVWGRSPGLDGGPLDVRDLGLEEALRDDLADWNDRCETAADPSDLLPVPTTPEAWRALSGESYGLAARLQRGLGDAWSVWCLGGGGHGGLRDPGAFGYRRRSGGPQLLLGDTGVVEWTPAGTRPALDRFPRALRDATRAWVRSTERMPGRERRARALELAGRLRAAVPRGDVLWFGGGDVPS